MHKAFEEIENDFVKSPSPIRFARKMMFEENPMQLRRRWTHMGIPEEFIDSHIQCMIIKEKEREIQVK